MPKIATLSIIDDKRLLPGAMEFIDSIAGRLPFPQAKLLKFKLACETIIALRMEKAYPNGGILDIDITLDANMMEVSVHDKGSPQYKDEGAFNPESVDENAEGLEDFLVTTMCDYTSSEKLGRHGQRVFVQLYLPVPLESVIALRSISAVVEETNKSNDGEVCINENTGSEKEIIAAINCIYEEYRYTYGYERLYYPENFRELINSKKLRSFLAVSDNDEIAGHYCLAESDDYPGMPEWATVVVRRPFRGRHIFDRLCGHGIEMAKQSGARAIVTQPTAYHTATQRVAAKHGYTATGLLFQYIQSDLESEYNKDARRLDLAIAVKFLTASPKGIAYLPEEHSDFIKEIYKKLGGNYEFLGGNIPEHETIMKCESNSLMKSGRIVVMCAGKSFLQELSHATGDLRRNHVEMAELLINMFDSAAPFAYESAKKCGYFFTGILPGGEKGDFLVMQNLFWGVVNAASVATEGEYKEFLRYLSKTVDCVK